MSSLCALATASLLSDLGRAVPVKEESGGEARAEEDCKTEVEEKVDAEAEEEEPLSKVTAKEEVEEDEETEEREGMEVDIAEDPVEEAGGGRAEAAEKGWGGICVCPCA